MTTIRVALLTWLVLGFTTTVTVAGTSFTVSIAMNKAGTAEACTTEKVTIDSKLDKLTVKIDVKQRRDLQLLLDRLGTVHKIKARATELKLPDAVYTDDKLLVMNITEKVCELLLAPPIAPVVTAPVATATAVAAAPTPPPIAEIDRSELIALEQRARVFLESKRITDHEVVKHSNFGRTIRLYHLPTGAPAFPLPRHVNEKDDVELWTVVPEGATISVEVSACDKVPAVRVGGTYKAAKDAVGSLQSGEAPSFRLDAYSRRLSCAGTLSYQIDVKHKGLSASTTTSLPFAPVYRFEWGIGLMFDFGRPRSLTLADRPTAGGAGTEKFVVQSDDYGGARPVLALGINVCGTNPAELTWCDRLLNPTLLVDPTKLTSGFGVGLTFRPFHGFGLLAGMTVFKSTVLAGDVRVEPGETWTIAGDLSTRDVFNEDSLGFVLAAVVSTDVLAALKQ